MSSAPREQFGLTHCNRMPRHALANASPSSSLIQQSILVHRPFTLSPTAIPIHQPDRNSPHYRSIRGEWQAANGYPVSAWKWLTVDREWRDVCRRSLWRDIVVDTSRSQVVLPSGD